MEAQRTYVQHFYKYKDVIAEFVETESDKDILNRPKLNEAISLFQQEKAILVVAKIDR